MQNIKNLNLNLLADPSINRTQTEHFDRHEHYFNFGKWQSSIKWLVCLILIVDSKGSFCVPTIFIFCQFAVRVKSAFEPSGPSLWPLYPVSTA